LSPVAPSILTCHLRYDSTCFAFFPERARPSRSFPSSKKKNEWEKDEGFGLFAFQEQGSHLLPTDRAARGFFMRRIEVAGLNGIKATQCVLSSDV
jgi:hypothetical protein